MTRRLAVAAGFLVVVAGVLGPVADATQTRPDPVVQGSSTVVEFTVETLRYRGGDAAAAAALWATCSATVNGGKTAPVLGADGVWTVQVRPGLGPHGRERLRGCLNDASLDRARAELVAFRTSGL